VVGLVVLPPLLYAASEELPWRDLRAVWRPVAVLAVGLVLASAAAVAAVAGAAASLSVSMAFVLGAVLASTDPVAVSALARRLSLPARVQALVPVVAFSQRRRGKRRLSWPVPAVVSWAGTRGVVPLAAALSIPFTTASGAPLPQRDLVLVLAAAAIGISLIVQGFTLEPLARLAGFGPAAGRPPGQAWATPIETSGSTAVMIASTGAIACRPGRHSG
jgi:NhaP-type Na+/H+ or K+/H+ antiporter